MEHGGSLEFGALLWQFGVAFFAIFRPSAEVPFDHIKHGILSNQQTIAKLQRRQQNVRGRGVAVFVSSLEIRGHEHQSEFNVVDGAPCDATNRDFSVLFHHHLLGLCLCGAFDVWSGSV